MKLLIVNQTVSKVPRRYLAQFIKEASDQLQRKKILPKSHTERELVLVFLGLVEAQSLNKKFRGKNYPTDVLSFEATDESSFGELIFCPHILKVQALEHDLSYRDELCYMALHGILHLLGFEHEKGGSDAKIMYALQDSIFEKIIPFN